MRDAGAQLDDMRARLREQGELVLKLRGRVEELERELDVSERLRLRGEAGCFSCILSESQEKIRPWR